MRRAAVVVVIGFGALAGIPRSGHSEVLGPLLPKHTLEIGIMFRKIDRVIEHEGRDPVTWTQDDYPVTLRYGVASNATISIELSADPNGIAFDEDVVQYTVGAGIETLIASHNQFRLNTSIHYYRRLDVFRSPGYCDDLTQGIDWTILGDYSFGLGRLDATIWGGPTVSYLIIEEQGPCEELSYVSDRVFGGVVGATLPSRIGIVLQGSLVWIDEPEYRINLGYRF